MHLSISYFYEVAEYAAFPNSVPYSTYEFDCSFNSSSPFHPKILSHSYIQSPFFFKECTLTYSTRVYSSWRFLASAALCFAFFALLAWADLSDLLCHPSSTELLLMCVKLTPWPFSHFPLSFSLTSDESSLKMNSVKHIPQTLASHIRTLQEVHGSHTHAADMLRPDPRDTFYKSEYINHMMYYNFQYSYTADLASYFQDFFFVQ